MTLSPYQLSLAQRLLGNKRQDRNARVQAQLYRKEREAVANGDVNQTHYAQEQCDLCISDLEERATELWTAYRRVIIDAGVPWSEGLRDEILKRMGAELEQDVNYVQEIARNVIVGHGHSFYLFLTDACKTTLSRLSAELTLFGTTHRPLLRSIATAFSNSRYDGPRGQWQRAEALLHAEVPEVLAAAREAIGAAEGLARIVTGVPTATFGESIKTLRTNRGLHPSVARALEAFWGMANTVPGLRHGAPTAQSVNAIEAHYVIEAAEAAIAFLVRLDQIEAGTLQGHPVAS